MSTFLPPSRRSAIVTPPTHPARTSSLAQRAGRPRICGTSGVTVHDPNNDRDAIDAPAVRIQAKLRVGTVNAPSEQEADRIAEMVVQSAEPRVNEIAMVEGGNVRRKCEGCGEDEDDSPILRKTIRGPISTEPSTSRPLTSYVEQAIAGERAYSGRKLDDGTRTLMEARLAADFSQVKIHDNARAAALADRLQARAFTVDCDIFFAAGQFIPSVTSGRRLLAHELVHVIQQRQAAPLGGKVSLVRRVTSPRSAQAWDTKGPVAIERALKLVNEAMRVLNDPTNAEMIRSLLGADTTAKVVAPLLTLLSEQIVQWKNNPGRVEYRSPRVCSPEVDAANEAGILHLCERFLREYSGTNDDKPLTIVHEAAHSLPGNQLFDVYDHTRLFRHLNELPGRRSIANPDSLAGLVEILVKGGSAATERATRAEALGYTAAPEDQVSGAPSRGAQALIHRAIAWSEAKVDAADTTLNALEALRKDTSGLDYAPDNARMAFALFWADKALDGKLGVTIENGSSNTKVSGINFAVDALAPVRATIQGLKAILAKPVEAVVDEQLESGAILWNDPVLKFSHDLFGRRPSGPDDFAFAFIAISELRLSKRILQAMAADLSHVEAIEQLFSGDKRGRGTWHNELDASIGMFEIVPPQ